MHINNQLKPTWRWDITADDEMKKFVLYFSILALCATLFSSCEENEPRKLIIGQWIIKSITWRTVQNDGSIKESVDTFDDDHTYYEFFENGTYALSNIPYGKWEIQNGNRLKFFDSKESDFDYICTILNLTSSELEIEREGESSDGKRRKDVYYFQKKKN